uniref:Uncharacterized protein n=1 Tax=Arundo donax TaxID=35708 RepID=A0A0A9CSN3_ARUDO
MPFEAQCLSSTRLVIFLLSPDKMYITIELLGILVELGVASKSHLAGEIVEASKGCCYRPKWTWRGSCYGSTIETALVSRGLQG